MTLEVTDRSEMEEANISLLHHSHLPNLPLSELDLLQKEEWIKEGYEPRKQFCEDISMNFAASRSKFFIFNRLKKHSLPLSLSLPQILLNGSKINKEEQNPPTNSKTSFFF